jgi:hypothetical protein
MAHDLIIWASWRLTGTKKIAVKRGRKDFWSLSIHMQLQLTRTEERVEREEKREEQWSSSSNPHAMAKDGALEGVTHKRTRMLGPLVGYLDLRALICTKTSLGILAVWLSP